MTLNPRWPTISPDVLFSFVGPDGLERFLWTLSWVLIACAAALTLWSPIGVLLFGAILPVGWASGRGFRGSIRVTATDVVVRKLWFGIPYRTYRSPGIEDVWYSGDWGLEDDAEGVVVKLIGVRAEICLGNRPTMQHLFDNLTRCRRGPAVSSQQEGPGTNANETEPPADGD